MGPSWPSLNRPLMTPDKELSTTEPPMLNASKTSLIPKPSESKDKLTSPLLKKTSPPRSPDGTVSRPSSTSSSLTSRTSKMPSMKLSTLLPTSLFLRKLSTDSTNDQVLYDER